MVDFPSNPVDGQTYTVGRKTWKYVALYKVWDLASTPDTDAVTAQAARIAAELARDASFALGPKYTTEALGRAAVADGATFLVVGSGDIACNEYRRTNSTTSVLIASYPSVSALAASRYQVHGKIDTYSQNVSFANGTAAGTVTLVWSRIYVIAGATQLKLAAGNFVVANNEALIVDLDQVPNGSGEYVVTKTAADFWSVDYSLGRKLLLYGHSFGRAGGPLLVAALTAKMVDDIATQGSVQSARADVNEISRYQAHGRFTTAYTDYTTNSLVVAWSVMRLFIGAQGVAPAQIAPLPTTTVANGQCLYIDLAQPKDGNGAYPVLVGSTFTLGSAFEGAKDKKIILISTSSSPTLVGGILADRFLAQSLAPTGRSMGHVVIPDVGVTVSFDPSTRTLGWSGGTGRVYFMTNDFSRRIRVAAGSIQFPAGTQSVNERLVAYLDTSAAAEVGGETPFANCIKIGRYYDGTTPFIAENWQIPLFCYHAGNYWPLMGFADMPLTIVGATAALSEDTLIVDHQTDIIKVYRKGAKEGSTRYLVHEFQHQSGGTSLSGYSAPHDVWRLTWSREVNKTGALSFTTVRDICNAGEAECALLEQGKLDFVGGQNHGNEIVSSVMLLVDGVPRAVTATGIYTCKRLQLFAGSILNRFGDSATTLADKNIYWDVQRSGLRLRQQIKWRAAVILTKAYLTMVGIFRRNNADTEQITDTGIREPLWQSEAMADTSFAEVRTLARYAKIWGPVGISAEVEIEKAPNIPNWQFYFSHLPDRNKMYFGDLAAPYTTSIGETWEIVSRIKIETLN